MSGKGGKGTPFSGKTALKTPSSKTGPLKGKDGRTKIQFESPDSSDSEGFLEEKAGASSKSGGKDSSGNMKTGKKASLDSLKTGGKSLYDTPTAKGGKDGKTGKDGGKGSVPTALPKVLMVVDVKLEIQLPKDAEVLMDCEAAAILQGIQEYMPSLSKDPSLKMPVSFNKALEHANYGDHYTSLDSVKKVAKKLKKKGVTDGEICMIARVCPETTDEIYALIPSLKANKEKNEGPIREALAELAKLKN